MNSRPCTAWLALGWLASGCAESPPAAAPATEPAPKVEPQASVTAAAEPVAALPAAAVPTVVVEEPAAPQPIKSAKRATEPKAQAAATSDEIPTTAAEMRKRGDAKLLKRIVTHNDTKLSLEYDFTAYEQIRGMEGSFVLRTGDGETLRKVRVVETRPLRPGRAVRMRENTTLDPADAKDKKLIATPVKQLAVEWIPERYHVAEGTLVRKK